MGKKTHKEAYYSCGYASSIIIMHRCMGRAVGADVVGSYGKELRTQNPAKTTVSITVPCTLMSMF